MAPTKRIVHCVALFILLYALLSAPWPGVQEGYSAAYRAVGNAVFGSFGSEGVVRFEPRTASYRWADTSVTIARRGSQQGLEIPEDPRLQGYLPTVATLALIAATPIPWSRRWRTLVWGFLWINGFVLLRLLIALLHLYDGTEPWCLYALSPLFSEVLYGTYELLVRSGTTSFLVPALIWLLVTFRRRDWERMLAAYRPE
ncbi:MAG: hypothetical protein PVI86_07075 [Phycisphaerae bacterium]|jgi:hypothetical protein